MWDVLGVGWFWTLERVRDVRGALGEADWVWTGCLEVVGLIVGRARETKSPVRVDWAVWFEDPSLRSG